jgi:hypothetical protein
MKIFKIIIISILLTVGFIAILAELTIHDISYAHLAANIVVRVCGVLMIVWAYHLIKHINDVELLDVELLDVDYEDDDYEDDDYEDDDMDRVIGKDEEIE